MNKKILAVLMALMMVLTSAVAFAAEGEATTRNDLIVKDFVVVDGINPAVNFAFTVDPVKVEHAADGATAPTISIANVSYDAGDSGKVALTFTGLDVEKFPSVGVYTYEIVETAGKVAGLDYDAKKITMKVLVEQGEKGLEIKSIGFSKEGVNAKLSNEEGFNNAYTAGDLSITKKVTGNLGDTSKYFKFTVTLTGETNKDTPANLAISGGSYESNPNTITVGQATTIYLKHGETISIANLPKGMTYTVVEDTYDGYTTTIDKADANGVIDVVEGDDETADDAIIFTNNKSDTIDTGVNTDSMPYIMLMAFVMIMAVAVVLKKRTVNE